MKWSTLLHHVLDEHQWLDGQCEHDELTGPPTDGDGRQIQYFHPCESSFRALQKLVMDKRWLESMKYSGWIALVYLYIKITIRQAHWES